MATPLTPGATPYASASLYVGDLSPEVSEALLFEIFNAVGPVASVRVCRDAATRRSLGYAYVNFHRVEDAERALDTMNFKNIRNRPCRIMWSHRDPSLRKSGLGNIFVKSLAKSIDHKTLYDTFSVFGNILSCKVAQNSKGVSLGYGFVHFETEEAAQMAIQKVEGKQIASQTVSVCQFKSKKERGDSKNKFTNLYVKNLPDDFTNDQLLELFSKYGTVTSSKMGGEDKEGKFRGFAFINFDKPEEALAAIGALNGKEIGDKKEKLYVSRHQKKDERERELRDRFEQRKIERQRAYAGVNLYVKNLADTIDDDRLLAEFSKFGTITSAKVMREGAKSKGFGFVCFSTPEEATKAVTEMNGRMVENKPLYVALAQRRDVRRAQLEAQYAARAAKFGVPPQMYPQPGAPMFYQPQRLMYPQMQPPRGWSPAAGGPGMMGVPRGVSGFQLMPLAGTRPSQPRGRGRGQRGGGAPKGPGGIPVSAGPAIGSIPAGPAPRREAPASVPAPLAAGVKFTRAARNQQATASPALAAAAVAPASGSESRLESHSLLDPKASASLIQDLAAAPEDKKKQIIGESLFPLIQEQKRDLAGKITGMLLEMDNGELIHLLESREALNEKIEEAVTVLQSHEEEDEEEEAEAADE